MFPGYITQNNLLYCVEAEKLLYYIHSAAILLSIEHLINFHAKIPRLPYFLKFFNYFRFFCQL